MRDLAIQASRLFWELDPSGEALTPCGRFVGSAASGEGEVAGGDELLWGWGVPRLPTPLPPPLPPLSPFWGVLVGVWVLWRSASCHLCLSISRFLHVTFVLVVATFARIPTDDGTPEMILMGHCFPIVSVLLSFQLQNTTTAMVTVRSMTEPSLVIDRFTVEEWGCTGLRFNLTHGTQPTPQVHKIIAHTSQTLPL